MPAVGKTSQYLNRQQGLDRDGCRWMRQRSCRAGLTVQTGWRGSNIMWPQFLQNLGSAGKNLAKMFLPCVASTWSMSDKLSAGLRASLTSFRLLNRSTFTWMKHECLLVQLQDASIVFDSECTQYTKLEALFFVVRNGMFQSLHLKMLLCWQICCRRTGRGLF